MSTGTIAEDFGKGLLAGLIGTVAITISQTIEMKIRGRGASSAPADAAGKVLGVAPTGEEEKKRCSQFVHFGYGTAWGGVRGLMQAAGLRGHLGTAAHFTAVSGAAMLMLPALGVAPPVTEEPPSEIAVESLHHLVYAVAVAAAFQRLSRSARADRESMDSQDDALAMRASA